MNAPNHGLEAAVKRPKLVIGIAVVALLAGAGLIAVAAQSSGTREVETWAPQFPRPGAEKVFENDKVIIWDEKMSTEPIFHKHVRDVIAVRLEDGAPVIVEQPDGSKPQAAPPQETRGPAKTGPRFSSYSKAGLGPHAEHSTDAKRPRHNLWIELKGTEPAGLVNGRWPK
jgi:hypothetical protein